MVIFQTLVKSILSVIDQTIVLFQTLVKSIVSVMIYVVNGIVCHDYI